METTLILCLFILTISFGTLALIYRRRVEREARKRENVEMALRLIHIKICEAVKDADILTAQSSSLPPPTQEQFIDYTFM